MTDNRPRQRRRKITLACEPCRERKSRCDGRKPICSTCEHRSLGLEHCIYKTANARTACSDDYTRALHERIRRLESACAMHGVDASSIDASGSTPVHLSAHQPENGQASPHVCSPSVLAILEPRQEQHNTPSACSSGPVGASDNASGMTGMGTVLSEEDLDESTHERDFYGRSSAASFLKEAAGSMRQDLDGPSRQPRRSQDTSSKTGDLSRFSDVDKYILPPRAFADHLVQRYWQRVYYLYPFFDRPAFEHAYQCLWQSDSGIAADPGQFQGLGLGGAGADASTGIFHCALNAVFALGCCFSDLSSVEKMTTMEVFFQRSKSFIGLDMIDENNLGVVQALLIVALVLQGMQFPSRCWNTVGTACRVAQGLGLHTEVSRHFRDAREKDIRQRTWHGCVIMDMLVSMTFGRPTMTSCVSILPGALDGGIYTAAETGFEQLNMTFYRESVRLGVILDGILQKIYQPWLTRDANAEGSSTTALNICYNLNTILELQGQLSNFENSVAPPISWVSPSVPKAVSKEDCVILEMQRNVLHARFIYMQLILHRPILTQLTVTDSATRHGISTTAPGHMLLSSDGLRYSFALQCGKSCVEASKRLIRLMHDVYLTESTDAIWWNGLYACTAGLVLIVTRLCPPLWRTLDHDEIATLWLQCQSILQHLASLSVSARKSLDLLLKINEHVLSKQSVKDNGAGHWSHVPVQDHGEAFVDAHGQSHNHVDMTQLDSTAPILEDTYMMGPMFTWDQALDFMPATANFFEI